MSGRGERDMASCDGSCDLDLFVIRADGTGLRQLTQGPASDFSGSVAPDGERLVYARKAATGHELVILTLDTGSQQVLIRSEDPVFDPAWSPDGTRIAVVHADAEDHATVAFVDPRSGDMTPGTTPPSSVRDTAPAWSPDGTRVAFVRRADADPNGGQVMVLDTGTGETTELVAADAPRFVAWSPDGTTILYSALGPSGSVDLFTFDQRSSEPEALVTAPHDDVIVDWSPDGRHIVFGRSRGDVFEIFVARSDGTGAARLPTGATSDSAPTWVP